MKGERRRREYEKRCLPSKVKTWRPDRMGTGTVSWGVQCERGQERVLLSRKDPGLESFGSVVDALLGSCC